MFDNGINLVGNLTADPDFKVTTGGVAMVKFRLASSRRVFDRTANEWRDGEAAYFSVTAWRQLAQNIHTSLRKGDRVIVVGRVRQSSYETSTKEKRTSWDVEAEAVGAELSWSYAQVQRSRRAATDTADTTDAGNMGNTADTAEMGDAFAERSVESGADAEFDSDLSFLASEAIGQERDGIELGEPASV